MNRRNVFCLAAVCFLSAGSAAHADYLAYSFSSSAPSLFYGNSLSGISVTGTGNFTPGSSMTANVTAFSFASVKAPQALSNVPLTLTLADMGPNHNVVSSQSYSLGSISGSLANVAGLLTYSGAASSLTFEGQNYSISAVNPTFFQIGSLANRWALAFNVTGPSLGSPSAPGGGTISSVGAPEPSSLVLAGIGVPLLGVFLRRRRA